MAKRTPATHKTTKTTTKTVQEAASSPIDPSFAPVAAAFAADRQVTVGRGWGAGNTVLKVKGKIFAMTVQGNLVAKLPKRRVDALVDEGVGHHFDPRRDGRLMKEWLVVAVGKANWVELAQEAHRFVAGGKP